MCRQCQNSLSKQFSLFSTDYGIGFSVIHQRREVQFQQIHASLHKYSPTLYQSNTVRIIFCHGSSRIQVAEYITEDRYQNFSTRKMKRTTESMKTTQIGKKKTNLCCLDVCSEHSFQIWREKNLQVFFLPQPHGVEPR